MTARRVFKLLRRSAYAALVVGASWAAGHYADRQLRAKLLQQTRMLAASICPDWIAALTGTPADLGTPVYRHFKEQLANVCRAQPGCRFAYLMASRSDGAIVFLVDNEPDDSPDCSWPGQVYTNCSKELISVLADGQPVVRGPYFDPWGTWVSAMAAVTTPAQGRPIGIGLDIDAHHWKWIVAAHAAIPAGLATIAILLTALTGRLLTSRRTLRDRKTELENSEQRLLELAAHSRTVAWETDADGLFTYVSPVMESVFGYHPDELVGKIHYHDLHPESGRAAFRQATLAVFASREPFVDYENAVVAKDGRTIWVSTSGLPQTGPDGTLRGYRGHTMDVTVRPRAEESLRENELKLRTLFDSMDEIVALHELICNAAGTPRDYRLTDVNEAFCRLTGLTRKEAIGKLASEVYRAMPPPYLNEYAQTTLSRTPCHFETFYSPLDKHFLISAVPLSDNRFATISMDITTRKRAEERLHTLLEESNQTRQALLGILEDHDRAAADLKRLATAIEQSADSIVVTDPQANIQYVNPAFETVSGYHREEVIGQNPRLLQSGQQNAEFYRRMWTTLRAGQTWKGRLVNRRKNGALYTEDAIISPVFDAQGQIANYVAVKRDISEQLRLSAQLQDARKLDSIGRLAGGVAHDFNNMLTVILGHAEMILSEASLTPDVRASLEEIRRAATESGALTRQLLAFARKQTIAPRRIDLNETVSVSLRMLHRLIGENIELIWQPAATALPVQADPSQMGQILVNLCVNARDAIAGTGQICIATGTARFDAAFCASHPGAVPGEYARLTVRDTGCGMDAETLAHVFEPFYTTKPAGTGTGLGLATVYGIVKQNAWIIDATSVPDQGSTFHVYLPRAAGPAAAAAAPAPPAAPADGSRTILLVEDEPAILAMTAQMLIRLGYVVRAAQTPAEAIRLAKEHSDPIHLLLTDIVMPGLNGRDLARTLRELQPGLRCLFMSGFTADVISRQGILDEEIHFLHKPFTRRELAAKLHQVFDA